MSADTMAPFFNPLGEGYMVNPYPHFGEMRDGDPAHLSLIDLWVLFKHDDVFRLLRDPSMSVMDDKIEVRDEARRAEMIEAAGGEFERDTSMLNTDPPDHTRLRRLVSKAFTPAAIQALRPRIQELVDEALDTMAANGGGGRRQGTCLPASVRCDLRDAGHAGQRQGPNRPMVGHDRQVT